MEVDINIPALLPIMILALVMAVPAALLAREKGRNVALWVILALIPIVNVAAIWYFVGTPDRRVSEKLDRLLAQLDASSRV